ncbi:RHS repeat-associated core domain-containing protein [Planctomycetota bacterium]
MIYTYQNEEVNIGSDFNESSNCFEGLIDNVMIFDRALSGAEVQALADAGGDNVLSVTATVYDDAGNLTTDYRGYKYSYDYENRLLDIKDSDDTSIVEYAYDALGRRIQKDDKIAGAKTRYYNNHDWQVLAEYDDDGYHLRSYIYGGYIDEVLVMVDPNAAQDYYYAHNHLYSPTALLDDAGDIIERYEYDAYGRPYFLDPNLAVSATQSSDYKNTVLFTGRTVDILDNGSLTLQYSRNRYYDYHTGRWLTKDPAGYIDGMNLYSYVSSNPVIYTDARGLFERELPSLYGCEFRNECEADGSDPYWYTCVKKCWELYPMTDEWETDPRFVECVDRCEEESPEFEDRDAPCGDFEFEDILDWYKPGMTFSEVLYKIRSGEGDPPSGGSVKGFLTGFLSSEVISTFAAIGNIIDPKSKCGKWYITTLAAFIVSADGDTEGCLHIHGSEVWDECLTSGELPPQVTGSIMLWDQLSVYLEAKCLSLIDKCGLY